MIGIVWAWTKSIILINIIQATDIILLRRTGTKKLLIVFVKLKPTIGNFDHTKVIEDKITRCRMLSITMKLHERSHVSIHGPILCSNAYLG